MKSWFLLFLTNPNGSCAIAEMLRGASETPPPWEIGLNTSSFFFKRSSASCCAKFSAITYPSCFSYSIKSKENQTTSRGVLTLNIDATETWHLIFPVISYCPPLLYFMLHHIFCHNIFTCHVIGCVIKYFLSFHISFPVISYFLSSHNYCYFISFPFMFFVISYFLSFKISFHLILPVILYFLASHIAKLNSNFNFNSNLSWV